MQFPLVSKYQQNKTKILKCSSFCYTRQSVVLLQNGFKSDHSQPHGKSGQRRRKRIRNKKSRLFGEQRPL